MKKILFAAAICCLALSVVSCNKAIPFEALPQSAKDFVKDNFPEMTVPFVKAEIFEYEMRLIDGTEIEFNRKGEWTKVEMEHSVLPESIIDALPEPIGKYLESTFPGVPLEKVSRGFMHSYELELVNDIELKFNSEGVLKSASF